MAYKTENSLVCTMVKRKTVNIPLWFLKWLYSSDTQFTFDMRISEFTRHLMNDSLELYYKEIIKVYGRKVKDE